MTISHHYISVAFGHKHDSFGYFGSLLPTTNSVVAPDLITKRTVVQLASFVSTPGPKKMNLTNIS